MGFDSDKQYSGTLPGAGRAEFGRADFSEDSLTVDVATRLIKVNYWSATALADPSRSLPNPYTNGIDTDGDISAGSVTFTRQTSRTDLSQGFNYELRGW